MTVQRNSRKRESAARFTLERIQVAAIAAAIFALPLLMWPGLTDYNYAKCIVSLVFISVLLALWGLTAWRRSSWTIRIPWLLVPVFAFVLAGVLSLLRATNGRVVVQSVVLLIYFALLLWMIANVVRDQRDVRWLLTALLASGTLAALYGVLQYYGIVPGSPGMTGVTAIISSMGNRNHLGGFLLYLLYPAFILVLRAKARWAKIFTLLLIAFIIVTMFLLHQAGTQVTLVVATVVLFVAWFAFRFARRARTNRWWLLALAGVVVALCVSSLFTVTNRNDKQPWLVRIWEANSGKIRTWDWWIGAEMYLDHPVLGVGLGNYKLNFISSKADFLATERGQAYDFYIPRASQAHNEYIQTGAELGAIGMVMLLCALGTLAVALWIRLKRTRGESRLDLLLLTTGILAFLVHSLVSFPAHVVGSSLEMIVFCGLALSVAYGKSASFAWSLSGWKGKGFHVLLIVIGIVVSSFAFADMRANWLMERGIDQVQAGLFATGEDTLNKSLALDFAPRQTYYYLAIAQIQQGKLIEAEQNLQKCMTRFVDEASLLNYANLLVNTGQSARAFEPLDLLLASLPRLEVRRRAVYLRAMAVSETGDPEGAILLIEEILAGELATETAYIGLGSIYESLERYDEARATYEAGLQQIEAVLEEIRGLVQAEGDLISAKRSIELQSRIEKLAYERATILERLRELPEAAAP
ncbi:O-antigen ligase family protein [Candidatus Bipolaricaulota bacterium]